jgi:hypothetical protein
LLGWLRVGLAESNALSGTLLCLRPGVCTNTLAVVGSPYAVPHRGERALVPATGQLVREADTFSGTFTNGFTLDAAQRFVLSDPGPDGLELRVKPGTGWLQGRVRDPASGRWLPIRGVVLQDAASASGFFTSPAGRGAIFTEATGPGPSSLSAR